MIRGFVVALIALSLASCGKPNTPDFLQKWASAMQYEIQASDLALSKGQSTAVRKWGKRMSGSYTKGLASLNDLIAAEKLDVKLPEKLDAEHQKLLDALTAATPADFDALYVKQESEFHKQTGELVSNYAKKGDNAALKELAENWANAEQKFADWSSKLELAPPPSADATTPSPPESPAEATPPPAAPSPTPAAPTEPAH